MEELKNDCKPPINWWASKVLKLNKNPEAKHIADVDVTFNELKHPADKRSLTPIFEFLRDFWVGENEEREVNCRIGTMHIYFNADGNLNMNFSTRFTLSEEVQKELIEALKEYWSKKGEK